MAIFGTLKLEDIIQIDDKTRLDGSKTFLSPDEAAITLIEIEPEAGAGFVDVTSNQYLDWQYSTDGVKTVSLRVTTDAAPVSFTKDITAISLADDRLYSTDGDLVLHEDDILSYVRIGRNSYLDKHREAQTRIVNWLDENRIFKVDGSRLTKVDISNIEEVRDWSKYLTLMMVFGAISNSIDDVFDQKRRQYEVLAKSASNRAVIRLDTNGDGLEDTRKDLRTFNMVRR